MRIVGFYPSVPNTTEAPFDALGNNVSVVKIGEWVRVGNDASPIDDIVESFVTEQHSNVDQLKKRLLEARREAHERSAREAQKLILDGESKGDTAADAVPDADAEADAAVPDAVPAAEADAPTFDPATFIPASLCIAGQRFAVTAMAHTSDKTTFVMKFLGVFDTEESAATFAQEVGRKANGEILATVSMFQWLCPIDCLSVDPQYIDADEGSAVSDIKQMMSAVA